MFIAIWQLLLIVTVLTNVVWLYWTHQTAKGGGWLGEGLVLLAGYSIATVMTLLIWVLYFAFMAVQPGEGLR